MARKGSPAPRAGAKRPGFTLFESLLCVSLIGTVSAAIFLLFYAGETSFVGVTDEGAAVAEAQSAMRMLATDVRAAAAFLPPGCGGLCVLRDDGRTVEFYQDGRVLKRVERTWAVADSKDEEKRWRWLDRFLEKQLGRGNDKKDDTIDKDGKKKDDEDEEDRIVRETTHSVASGLAAVDGFTLQFYDERMNAIGAPRQAKEYDRAAAVQATVVVPWAHDGLGRVMRTTLLAPRNDD
jgi:type II secretory pathway pseudopilin PulG